MMLARQPGSGGDTKQNGAHNAAQGVLSERLVVDLLPVRHCPVSNATTQICSMEAATIEVEGFCCPVPSEPRLTWLNARASNSTFSRRVTQREQPQHSCRWQLF